MQLHHDKHHQTYFDKFNLALENYPKLKSQPPEELLKKLTSLPEEIREAVKFHGGGHVNHEMFWSILKKEVKASGEVVSAIVKKYGSLEKFQEEFKTAALSIKGSGWVWLILDKKELSIITTSNQDSPLSMGKTPLLLLDMWEHAFYLKYQNRKSEYIDAFFKVINWKQVNSLYMAGLK
jgi:Fe-Mn family superoxide dismutase